MISSKTNIANSRFFYYRRQFLLSSAKLNRFPSWKKARISNLFYLEVHPDLELNQVQANGVGLTLLGYLIDPDHSERGNSDILRDILQLATDDRDLFKQTTRFSGRWILISNSNVSTILFNDPTGLRSVYYTDFHVEPFCCASQPGLIADILDSQYSKDAKNHFLNSSYFKNDKEYWWPSGTSLYEAIKHLVPNHYINLQKKEIKRFWPWESISSMDLEEGVVQSSVLLKNLMESAANRFELAMTITAGIDSRSLLAATRDICEKIHYYTLIYYDLNHKSPDIRIPKRLLSSFGLQHHILDCSSLMDDDFRNIYMQNVDNSHEAWGNIAFGLSKKFPSGKVCVKGTCSEIARCFYYKDHYPKFIDGYVLAKLNGMHNSKFAILHFEKWLKDSQAVANGSDIDILDLFYWEHRMGSWQAMSQLEWDIVHETYTPFNCRDLLSILLSVNRRYRKAPEYKLYQDIISALWPELLSEPINPKPLRDRLKDIVKKLLIMTSTYELAKRFS